MVASADLVHSEAELQYGTTNEGRMSDPCDGLAEPYNSLVGGMVMLWNDGGPEDPVLRTSNLPNRLFTPAVSMMSNLAGLRWDVTAATSSDIMKDQPNTYHFTRDVQALEDEACEINSLSCTFYAVADQVAVTLTDDGRVSKVSYSFTDRDASLAAAEREAQKQGTHGQATVSTLIFDSYDALPKLKLAGVADVRAADPGEWTYPSPDATINSPAGVCEFLRLVQEGGCDTFVKRLGF